MEKIYTCNWKLAAILIVLVILFCTGVGMGVPLLNILFGLPIGWWAVARCLRRYPKTSQVLSATMLIAALAAGFTLILMIIIWAPSLAMLWDAQADLANFGIPLILYDPLWSFLGWQALMILVSPFLQFLMSLLGAFLQLLVWHSRKD